MRNLFLTILFIFMAISNSQAEIPWKSFEFFNNTGGLNNAFSTIAVADNEAVDIQNIVFTTSGSFETRSGFDNINTTTLGASVIATGLKYYKPTSGSEYLVGIFDDDKIYKMDYSSGPDGTWDDITGSLSFLVGQNNLASFAVGEDTLIIEDGLNTTAPYKWTGTGNAAALGGSPPNATMVAYHKRMAFAAGNNTNPSILYYSDVGDIENWTTGLSGNVSVETNDGTSITAIVPGFDALYIFKGGGILGSIWRLTGDDEDTFVLQRMMPDIGTLSRNGVCSIGNEFFFQSQKGDVYIYDGAIGLRIISNKIEPGYNLTRLANFSCTIFDSDYYLAYSTSSSSTNDRVLVYDTYNEAFTIFDGMDANVLAVGNDSVGAEFLMFGDYAGLTYNYPEGTNDNGTAIDAYYLTKQYRFPEVAGSPKDWKLLKVFAAQQGSYNLNVELRTDFGSAGSTETISLAGSGSLWGTAVYGTDLYGGQNLIVGRIEANKTGDFFQVRFSNSTVDQLFEVKGFSMFMADSDRI